MPDAPREGGAVAMVIYGERKKVVSDFFVVLWLHLLGQLCRTDGMSLQNMTRQCVRQNIQKVRQVSRSIRLRTCPTASHFRPSCSLQSSRRISCVSHQVGLPGLDMCMSWVKRKSVPPIWHSLHEPEMLFSSPDTTGLRFHLQCLHTRAPDLPIYQGPGC